MYNGTQPELDGRQETLLGIAEKVQAEFAALPAPAHLSADAQEQYLAGQKIYHREGHCVTCHQPHGQGLDPAFPSIAKSPWVNTDENRLIKLSLFGLMGPVEINGKKYDGTVPMTPFGGMLNDEELASVLTFVRNSFGNQADPVTADKVKAVRTTSGARATLYTVEDLLKEHPLK